MPCTRSWSLIHKVWSAASPKQQQNQVAGDPPAPLSGPTRQRRRESLSETAFDTAQLVQEVRQNDDAARKDTVLYLAYGSNLSAATFRGSRGIRPLSQVNVVVPSLSLTFDLPGIPYSEPCFANTRHRHEEEPSAVAVRILASAPASTSAPVSAVDYHKDRWHKGLVGVVYEVSKADYATIIASEGGGSGYHDIIVSCHEIPAGARFVDPHPATPPFKAHTLFAPSAPSAVTSPPPPPTTDPARALSTGSGRVSRPDPSYAQPSARYLKLITDGAAEHDLPLEYRSFLDTIRPYTVTSVRQRLGQIVFLALWMPVVLALFAATRLFVDDSGRLPAWMVALSTAVFAAVWASYDAFFRPAFGDGERTQGRGGEWGQEAGRDGSGGVSEKVPLLAAATAAATVKSKG